MKKKLIEVALPLEAINAESAREKSIRHGHPSTLHLWWARRPLAAARAVIFASLVDDPSSRPDEYPTEEAQAQRRRELFDLIKDLVKWENSNNEAVLEAARAEIRKATGGRPPALLDPFAGGGSIPLEAQRLGLEAHAHDLNPVAVLINKAMIEIPPKFAGRPPVHPGQAAALVWEGARGLAEDVRYYGQWMKDEAFKRIGHLYPKVKVPKGQGGGQATVIAWIWARTVKCPNPACGCEMPLASSFVLSKKAGKEAWIEPVIDKANNKINFNVKSGPGTPPAPPKTARGAKFKCVKCGTPTTPDYIKEEAMAGRLGAALMAVVAEGPNGRIYLAPDEIQRTAAKVAKPDDYPDGELPGNTRWFSPPVFGMTHFSHLFTPRQLTALTTFSALVKEARQKAEHDALAAGMKNDRIPLAEGGAGAMAYGQAVGVYLAFAVDRLANYSSSLNAWGGEFIVQTFGRQALPMVWDYAESNPFSKSTGNWSGAIHWVVLSMNNFPYNNFISYANQNDAQSDNGLRNIMISTDPPYYDNIGYADLSDYFYIWLRQSLKGTYPEIFSTMLVPKSEELVATPYRFEGSREKARNFFEAGMLEVFQRICSYARDDIPVTIYYAFKQSEAGEDDGGEQQTASTGWETMLSAIIQAGFTITATWPMRTERPTGLKAYENALASSIVLVCRKRPAEVPSCSRRDFLNALRRELKPALAELQKANIAPVDLAQAAIGPGMAVYSRCAQVLEARGAVMGVRAALGLINEEVDNYFSRP